jgi:hypothetical protein
MQTGRPCVGYRKVQDTRLFFAASRAALLSLLPNGNRGTFPPGVRRQERETDNSFRSVNDVKYDREGTSTPAYVFMA